MGNQTLMLVVVMKHKFRKEKVHWCNETYAYYSYEEWFKAYQEKIVTK